MSVHNVLVSYVYHSFMYKSGWKNMHISMALKLRLYKSLVTSTVLYAAQLWVIFSERRKVRGPAHRRGQNPEFCFVGVCSRTNI